MPLLGGQSTYNWLGPYFILPLVALVAHAIIRHRLMDLRVIIPRGLAYLIVIALVSAGLLGLKRLGAVSWSLSNLQTIAIVALAMLTTPAQRLVDRVIDPYLYRGRIRYDSALRDATRRLTHLMQPARLAAELRGIVTEAFVPESFVVLARSREGGAFEPIAPTAPEVAEFPPLESLMTVIAEQPIPSIVTVNAAREAGAQKAAHDALQSAGVEIVMALGRRDQLLGLVLLGPRKSGDAYYTQDLDFIESLAELASVALDNALLYRQRIQMLEYSDRLLESLDPAVVAVDVTGKIASFNRSAHALLGLSERDRGAPLAGLPSEVGWALALAVGGAWLPREVEASIERATRGALPVILSTAVLRDDQQQVTGALAVVTDLSKVKALERNQRRLEHLTMMTRFYAGIAHEIRTPLTSISNFIAMFPDRFEDPEYRALFTRLLPGEVGRIARLADRLRLMAPSEDGKLVSVEVAPLLADIVAIHAPAAKDHGVKVRLDAPRDLPKINGDAGQLVQLFVNLLKNAIEAMPDGGTVTIEAAHVRDHSDAVVVRVIDEGTGVDPTVRAKLFQPFVTTKSSGTGLGLSICREIAEFHRARLALVSRVNGRGTVAQVEFPSLTPN